MDLEKELHLLKAYQKACLQLLLHHQAFKTFLKVNSKEKLFEKSLAVSAELPDFLNEP